MVAIFAPTARLAEAMVITVPASAENPPENEVFLKSLADQLVRQVCRQLRADYIIHGRRLALHGPGGQPDSASPHGPFQAAPVLLGPLNSPRSNERQLLH